MLQRLPSPSSARGVRGRRCLAGRFPGVSGSWNLRHDDGQARSGFQAHAPAPVIDALRKSLCGEIQDVVPVALDAGRANLHGHFLARELHAVLQPPGSLQARRGPDLRKPSACCSSAAVYSHPECGPGDRRSFSRPYDRAVNGRVQQPSPVSISKTSPASVTRGLLGGV